MPPKKSKAARTEEDSSSAAGDDNQQQQQQQQRGTDHILGAEEKYKTGPFSLLYHAVHTPSTRVLILCRNQKRLIAKVRAFDRHFNMLLQDGQEISDETNDSGVPKTRPIPKMFLRGDTVISVVAVKADE